MKRIFIDGLSGMAQGLFATLIIGTIIQQLGMFVGGNYGDLIYLIGKVAAALTGAGIGVGVARKLEAQQLVTVCAAVVGMIGAFAGKILAGQVLVDGNIVLAGPGEPLGAFVAAYVAIEIGILVTGRTKLDIILTPLICIGVGAVVGLFVGPPISSFMNWLGSLINWGTEQQPFLMGIVVSVLMGMILTLPISSAALGVILNLSGLAAGAATVGCCCNMIGFAVASYRENKIGGFLAQGIGTSMLQVPNIMRHPLIWIPSILSSAILGPVSTMLLHMTNNATGSGMGTAGLVGPLMTWQVMIQTEDPMIVLVKIIVIQFVLPAVITLGISEFMRKKGCILGGEQSGHIIFSKYASTGDGILTSLKMMEVMMARKKTMSQLTEDLHIYPQVLVNVRVQDKAVAQADPDVQAAVQKVADELGDTGRILVRESGTEPLIRVMVEAETHDICQKYVDDVVNVINEKEKTR